MKQPNRTFDKGGRVLWRAAAARREKRKQINLRTRANEDEQGDGEVGWPGVRFGEEEEVMKLQLYRETTRRWRRRWRGREELGWFRSHLWLFDVVSHRSESPACSVPALPSTSLIQIRSPVPSSAGCIKTHKPILIGRHRQQQHTPARVCIFPVRGVFDAESNPGHLILVVILYGNCLLCCVEKTSGGGERKIEREREREEMEQRERRNRGRRCTTLRMGWRLNVAISISGTSVNLISWLL